MIKTIVKIDGMACSMCEAHVNDIVRATFDIKKVRSSHKKGRTEIISEERIDTKKLTDALAANGYIVEGVENDGGNEE